MSKSLTKPVKNPFNKCSYYYYKYNKHPGYIKYYPELFTYPETLVNDLPETMKADDIIPFSELTELDMSRNINTEIDFSKTFDPSAPTEYTGAETSIDDPQYLQISSFELITKPITEPITEPIIEPSDRSTSRYIFREINKPMYKSIPISHKTNLSTPMKSINKIKRPSGRRPNMPLYDDEYHKSRREYAGYKKQLMYKSMTFTILLSTYGNLPQPKFYSNFEKWLVAHNIIDLETTKLYIQQYKLYRNLISQNV